MLLIDFIKYISIETDIYIEDENHVYICHIRKDKVFVCPHEYLERKVKVAYADCYCELAILLED